MAGRIDIRDLAFGYTDKTEDRIFSNINISLKPGEVFCLLGPNGSGKSTLLKCISRLLKPAKGQVAIDGKDLNTMSPGHIAGKLGYVPQSLVSAFPFTVEEIVVMGRASRISMISSPSKRDRGKARESMEKIGIAHLARRPCNRLSGGEWQLVLIARALTQSPRVLLLDEPTSHLDLGNQVKILEKVNGLSKEGITIIMASHFPDHAFLNADQAGILKNRSMAVSGKPDQVLTEKVLSATYGISVRVIEVLDGINRKICVPVLKRHERITENI